MSLTPAQQEAVTARGNVVVVAGAGAGKTSTLVARCLHCLLDEHTPVPLDALLLVTFTDTAAADMRKKIRAEIEKRIKEGDAENPKSEIRNPKGQDAQRRGWLTEQLALFETAHIGTLHSFCLQLVREHFYELELDPQLTVMPEEEQHLQAEETLDKIFEGHYASKTKESKAVQELIQIQGRGSEMPIRALVLKLHHYAQTLRDPAAWFSDQLAMFESPEPARWADWLAEGIQAWRGRWLPALRAEAGNPKAAACAEALECLGKEPSRSECAAVLERALAIDGSWPKGQKVILRKPLEDFFEGTKFLRSLTRTRTDWVPSPQRPKMASRAKTPARVTSVEPEEEEDGGADPDFGKLWEMEDDSPAAQGDIVLANEQMAGRAEMAATSVPRVTAPDPPHGAEDPLAEDWNWVRQQMTTLLSLALEFGKAFSRTKRELGVVDFHDLEQHALCLLIDPLTKEPSRIARQWQSKLRFVFVDEYQDINEAQDAILRALSRDGAAANRFMVGDVKQSIYRFRLADPHIFQNYIRGGGDRRIISLADNFRSREAILGFINSFFSGLMREEIGGVPYDAAAQLRFGNPENRRELGLRHDPTPRVELRLRLKRGSEDFIPSDDESDTVRKRAWTEIMNLEEPEKEARMVALRLKELKAESHLIWDEPTKAMRPIEWRDMAILLRSPSRKAEAYAKEFTRLGVPLLVARGGFYESMEVTDLLSLLQLLDNPLQDLPLLAVLHSPLVGMSLDELATIRLMLPRGTFWAALQRYHEAHEAQKSKSPARRNKTAPAKPEIPSSSGTPPEGWTKANRFLENYAAWRRLARQDSLSRCLETVLTETHYSAWLLTQSRGEQRCANIQRLLALAQQFDRFQRQGLFRFLRFIEAQQDAETEPEVGLVSAENAVSLMSIHQSKGLEFPVVVVADLAKPFNLSDLRADIILDEQYGLCPQVKPPQTGRRYPSLPYWLAKQRQRRETLGEEMRLLYVAMTRARDTLILTGTVSERDFDKRWTTASPVPAQGSAGNELWSCSTPALLSARGYLDWIAAWSVSLSGALVTGPGGANPWLRWAICEDAWLMLGDQPLATGPELAATASPPPDPRQLRKLQDRLSWKYPHSASMQFPAKTSVSILRRQLAEADGDEVLNFIESKVQGPRSKVGKWARAAAPSGDPRKLSAAQVGSAHHTFLQWVSLDCLGGVEQIESEARRLVQEGALLPAEAAQLDLDGLAAFWNSGPGRKIRAQGKHVRRELAFTARFSPEELTRAMPAELDLFEHEFVVVQGVADLVVLLPDEIWLVDLKTDELREDELEQRARSYEPQIRLYGMALSRIYRRAVRESYLHFLALRRTVKVGTKSSKIGE